MSRSSVAALLDGAAALANLRKTLAPGGPAVLVCRRAAHLRRALESRLVDAVVIGPQAAGAIEPIAFRARFPRVPVIVFGGVRADDGPLVLEFQERFEAAALLVEGVDDPAVGDAVARHGLAARRRLALADGPRLLRLTTPLQLAAWQLLLDRIGRAPRTGAVAARLRVSREHLSRQFGAGGAPNLKRVIDFLQVVAARELLGNPGCPPAAVARMLGYSTVSHFRSVVRRAVRLTPSDLSRPGGPDLVRRFLTTGMRSRP